MMKVFLTYSAKDNSIANLLRAQLKGNSSLPIDIMNDAINPGQFISSQIRNSIQESSIVLSLVSNNFSDGQLLEISEAINLGKPIFGILLSDVHNEKVLEIYASKNIPLYDWTYQKLISLVFGKSNSLEYKLQNESLIGSPEIKIDFKEISNKLTEHFIKHPEAIHNLEPRKYEEFIAYLLEKLGYEITLTQQSRDKGVDIYALKKNELGDFLTIVDCKKYSLKRPIGIGMVRTLYGTLDIEKASHGIIASTSTFSKDARIFEEHHKYQISLKDHHDIYKWIEEVYSNNRI